MPVSRINAISVTSTRNPETLSIAPTATALAEDRPIRPKNRISRAIRAAELGTARAMNAMAHCRASTGPNRTGRMHEPIVPNACATPTTGTTTIAATSQPSSAAWNSSIRLSDADVRDRRDHGPRDEADHDDHHDRADRDAAELLELRHLDAGDLGRRCARRSSSFQPASDSARRVDRLSAAGCRYGRTAAIGVPAERGAGAARTARSVPHRQRGRDEQLRAVGLHGHGRRRHGGAAELAERGRPVGPDRRPRRRPAARARSARGTARRRAPRCAASVASSTSPGPSADSGRASPSRSRGSRRVPRRAPRSPPAAPRSPTARRGA